MATLHIVSRGQALESCLRIAAAGDTVLLIEQAIDAAKEPCKRTLVLLRDHCENASWLRDTSRPDLATTDYSGFVDLVVTHQPVVTWR